MKKYLNNICVSNTTYGLALSIKCRTSFLSSKEVYFRNFVGSSFLLGSQHVKFHTWPTIQPSKSFFSE